MLITTSEQLNSSHETVLVLRQGVHPQSGSNKSACKRYSLQGICKQKLPSLNPGRIPSDSQILTIRRPNMETVALWEPPSMLRNHQVQPRRSSATVLVGSFPASWVQMHCMAVESSAQLRPSEVCAAASIHKHATPQLHESQRIVITGFFDVSDECSCGFHNYSSDAKALHN